jgi:hypothetical protein
VHALRHVHRLLVPGGTMVDLHPLTEEHVEDARGHVGVIAEPEFVGIDLPNAEAYLREAIEAGLYTLEAETEFDVLQHYDRADELLQARAEVLADQRPLAERIRAASPPLTVREHVVLRRLRASDPH